jgi:hypothetical protein
MSFVPHTQGHTGPQAGLPISAMPPPSLPFPDQSWDTSQQIYFYQGQHDTQAEFTGVDPLLGLSMGLGASGPSHEPQTRSGVSQMGSPADRSSVQHGLESTVNITPLMQYSHEQSASVVYHQQFEHWGEVPLPRSVSTPYSITAARFVQSSRTPGPKPSDRQNPLNGSGKHFVPSITDSGYGGSRPSTHSDGSQNPLDFHAQSFTESREVNGIPSCHLHRSLPDENGLWQPRQGVEETPVCGQFLYAVVHYP